MSISRRTVLSAIPFAVLAAGCSTEGGGATAPAPSVTGPGPGGYKMDLGGYTGPELTDQPITLRLMRQNWNGAADQVFDAQVAAFLAAYPNITVKQELVPYGDLGQKLRSSYAAGSAPDIAMGDSALATAYVFGEMLVPVGDYFTQAYRDDILPSLTESLTIDDHVYGIPRMHNAQGILYNKDLYEKAGIAHPEASLELSDGWTLEQWLSTWTEMRAWMDANGDSTMYPVAPSTYGNGGPGSNYQQLEQTWLRMLGSPDAPKDSDEYKVFAGISPDGKTVNGYINNPLAVQGMKNYQSLFANRLTPTGAQPAMYQSGQASCRFGASIIAGVDFQQGVTPLPRVRTVAASAASDTFLVISQTDHPAEAAALLAAVTTPQVLSNLTEAFPQPPPLKSIADNLPAKLDTIEYRTGVSLARAAFPMPKTAGWFEYNARMNEATRDIALGADIQKTLDEAARAIDQQLAKYV